MILETERLIITELTIEMIEDFQKNSLDDDTRSFVPDEVFETLEDARKTVEYLIEHAKTKDGPFVYATLTKDGTNIGYVQLVQIEEGWEIGFHIAKDYTSKGYATEAVKAFLPYIADTFNLDKVYGICLAENKASAHVMKKCGFTNLFTGEGLYQGQKRQIVRNVYTF